MSDTIIAEFCREMVLMMLLESNVDRNKDKRFDILWHSVENLYPISKIKTLEEWKSNFLKTRNNCVKVDYHLFKIILEMIDDKWKWPLLMSLNIEICKRHLNNIGHDETKWSDFFTTILFLVNLLFKLNSSEHIPMSSSIQLCLKQIKNKLCFFVAAIEKKSTVIKKYTLNCLASCLIQLQEDIVNKTEISCNEFVDLMDSAISQLDILVGDNSQCIPRYDINDFKKIVDELLCHAMTTAHVTPDNHAKEKILSKGQVILREIESLKDALTEQENSTIRLTAQSLCDALCNLERLVNSAVLKLFLHVCMYGDAPIKNLVKICQPNVDGIVVNRKSSDLDDLITCFDSYLDRIMQIGSFAISCSSSSKKSVELKSCLASFESLEVELVPCLTTMYLNPADDNKRDLKLLVKHWQEESTKFFNVMDTIIDPAAYTEVVKSFLAESFKNFEEDHYASHEILKTMVKAVRTLNGVIQVSIQLGTFGESPELEERFDLVIQAALKCENLYSNQEGKEMTSLKRKKYFAKYSRTLLDSVDSLLCYQTSKLLESQLSNDISVAAPINYYKLCVSDVGSPETDFLAYHIAEGERMAKKSVLYNTPKRNARMVAKTPIPKSAVKDARCSTIARNRHRFSVKRNDLRKDELSDMELTMLLDDIKGTDGTFSVDDTVLLCKDFQVRNLLDLFADWTDLMDSTNKSLTCSSNNPINSTPDSNHVDTLERMRDLMTVQEKIDNLKN